MKRVRPGLHPERLGEVSLNKEVPTRKKFSPGQAQDLMGKWTPREEPFTTTEDKPPQEVQGLGLRCLSVFVLCDVRDIA